MKPQILQVFLIIFGFWRGFCVYGNMISFCGVYFHNFTLCHFYALFNIFGIKLLSRGRDCMDLQLPVQSVPITNGND
jgi:hypothetical protein